ncbi:O-antigen ligase family protein [Candidatus Falkowbacteria bacterium]|nr:O-antigen ligase family protein [Candidatus Falkowbacteria bacterium]
MTDFFGKTFKYTFLFLALLELFSLLGSVIPQLNQTIFFIITLGAIILTLHKLEHGFYLLLAELFVGGKGYLFSLDVSGMVLSIRMVLFLIVIAVWLVKQIQNSKFKISKKNLLPTSYLLLPYSLLSLFVTIGLINVSLNNEPRNVFFDFNAWLYFALIFVFFHLLKNKTVIRESIQVLTAATSYLALKTLVVLLLFSHNVAGIGGVFYKWIRDSGVGEITYVSGTIFRVFFQSQIYILIGFLIILTILISQKKLDKKSLWLSGAYLYLASLAILISQSRSFWVGGVLALLTLIIIGWWRLGLEIKKTTGLIIILIIMFISQIFLVQLLTGNLTGNLVGERFKNLPTEAAGQSRLNQLEPLTYNIFQRAVFGYGFGKELTYLSSDPRILETHPGGVYTTYAFEWGYLDIWLKIGLLGLFSYGLLIGVIFYQGIQNPKSKIQNLGLLIGLVALLITNIFSPYLNHPLGIGYIMLVSAILINERNASLINPKL